MKTLFTTIVASLVSVTSCLAFGEPIEFGDKCKRSDVIIRGVVVDIVTIANDTKDSRGAQREILEGEWTGPKSVAIVRVVSVLKGEKMNIKSLIFIPCGYDFDESPCELTKSKDYILFLESMGHNYFHPLGYNCMHRIQNNLVGMSGLDWDGDFDPDQKNGKSTSLDEFIKRIETATKQG